MLGIALWLVAIVWLGAVMPVYGQTPTPLPDDTVDPASVGLAPGWTEQPDQRGASHATFTKPGYMSVQSIVWAAPEFYWRADVGKWRRKNPKFMTVGSDDVTVDNDMTVRLTNSPTRIEITDDHGDGVAFPLAARAVRTSDTTFTATVGAITLTYTVLPSGV